MIPSTFEDYLEAILTITESGGRAATLDEIAAALDTGKETAGTTVASLVEEGYLERADGDAVRLTGKGSSVASQVARKHRVLQCFLTEMLGVDEDAASREACTLEHGISDETIDRLSPTWTAPSLRRDAWGAAGGWTARCSTARKAIPSGWR